MKKEPRAVPIRAASFQVRTKPGKPGEPGEKAQVVTKAAKEKKEQQK